MSLSRSTELTSRTSQAGAFWYKEFAEAMTHNYLLMSAWETGPVPWADGVRNLFIEITPRRISGRSVQGFLWRPMIKPSEVN